MEFINQRRKKENCEDSLRDLREDTNKQKNIHLIGVAEGKKEEKGQKA